MLYGWRQLVLHIKRLSFGEWESLVSLKNLIAASVVGLSMFVAAPKASAATIAFSCITNNSGSCGSYAGFFSGNVVVSGNQMLATISNNGTDGSIGQIYVDAPGAGAGYSLTSIIEGAGVDFNPPNVGSPSALPSSNTANPTFVTNFFATAASPAPTNGVNPGEFVTLVFTLEAGQTQSLIDSLLASGDLRFGLHVVSLGAFSEAFVSTGGGSPVPEPTSMLLLGTGLLAAARARRKKTI